MQMLMKRNDESKTAVADGNQQRANALGSLQVGAACHFAVSFPRYVQMRL
jgi:hypothetical protein